jgi:hypothetical protein
MFFKDMAVGLDIFNYASCQGSENDTGNDAETSIEIVFGLKNQILFWEAFLVKVLIG